jgi:hypothetical protein
MDDRYLRGLCHREAGTDKRTLKPCPLSGEQGTELETAPAPALAGQ